jgi:hypothetical protein
MELNPKKCKEMIINFLQYRIACDQSMFINGLCVERVHSFKLLGVYLSEDLTWNTHVDRILKKTNSRLFALRLLKKAGLGLTDLITIYCSVIRSIPEYASPVWAALPGYLSSHLESVQKRAITYTINIYPDIPYYDLLKHYRPHSSKPWNVEEMSYVGDLSTQPGRKHVKIQSII